MPQHPRLSAPPIEVWASNHSDLHQTNEVRELLLALIVVDATLVRHGRTDQARALRKAVSKIIEG